MDNKQLIGIIGSILLLIGIFSPILNVQVLGNFNYFRNGKADGVIVLILAVISLVLAISRKFKILLFTGIGSLLTVGFTFVALLIKISQAKNELKALFPEELSEVFSSTTNQLIQLQWGWALLIAGASLIILSAIMKESHSNQIYTDISEDSL